MPIEQVKLDSFIYGVRTPISQFVATEAPFRSHAWLEIEVSSCVSNNLETLAELRLKSSLKLVPVLVDNRPFGESTQADWLLAVEQLARFQESVWVFGADEDGAWHQAISPRFGHKAWKNLLKTLALAQKIQPGMQLAMVVEELCPNGMDPCMGLELAEAARELGVEAILASGGTRDLPALKWRRPTTSKSAHPLTEGEAWLSSMLWLSDQKVPLLAQGCPGDLGKAIEVAKSLKLTGIVDVSGKHPSFS